ncbi:MAG: hypothetical protein MJ237_09100 [bacterium]|nr:hypothetical protein [bacterium]
MRDLLTVKEFATAAKVSQAAIYKAINTGKLQKYSVKRGGKSFVEKSALQYYETYNLTNETENQPKESTEKTENQPIQPKDSTYYITISKNYLNHLEDTISETQQANKELRAQITELENKLMKLAENAQEIARNAQILQLQSANNGKKIPLLKRLFFRKEEERPE